MKHYLIPLLGLGAALACSSCQTQTAKAQPLPQQPVNRADQVEISTYDYAIKGNDTLKIDIYLHPEYKDAENLPVMLYVHGGGFSMGSRKNAAQEVFLRHFAEQGFLAASMDYRLGFAEGNPYNIASLSDAERLATTDMADATCYILDNFKVDRNRVLASGGSAGGMTIMQMEYDLCNDEPYLQGKLPEGFNYAGLIPAAGAITVPGGQELKWAKTPCPALFMAGGSDVTVPTGSGECLGMIVKGIHEMDKSYAAMDVPHWTYIEKGADHIVAMTHLTNNLEEADKFYRSYVVDGKKSSAYTEWADAEPGSMSDVMMMVKFAPLYILGYDKYMHEIDWGNLDKPTDIVY
ncbi:MAG: carboxylesterase family protein [Bacteroidales bacterium]|nr:carboxylesterase family protein [Bacteroidales bacterium]